jgi:hypothetical protein
MHWNIFKNLRIGLPCNINILVTLSGVLILIFILGVSTAIAGDERSRGPLKARNQFPPFLMFINPLPASSGTLSKNEIKFSPAIDYSSIFIDKNSGNWDVLMDMELTVIDLLMEYGITEKLTLSFQPLFIHMGDGFMDNFLETYHDKLGVSNAGRENRPKNEFGYLISYEGQTWVQGKEGGLHLADSLISAKYSLLKDSRTFPVDISLAYMLKIPFGDSKSGFGSGHVDHGLHFLSQVHLDPVLVYLNGGYNFLSDPDTNGAAIQVDDTISLFIGFEYLYSADLSVIVQMNYFSSPFQDVEFSQFEEGGLELDFGFIYQLSPRADFEFAFGEDLATSGVPDFNLHFRVSYSFLVL